MQTVAYLDENHTDILTHCKKQLLEILCLCRCLLTEDTAADLCQTINNLCDFGTEDVGNVFNRIVGIFHNVVQQC